MHIIFHKINGYIKNCRGIKYLEWIPTKEKVKFMLKKYKKLYDKRNKIIIPAGNFNDKY